MDATDRYVVITVPGGAVGLVTSSRGLWQVILLKPETARDAPSMAARMPHAKLDADLLPGLQRQIRDYFAGKPAQFRVKIDLSTASPFHRRVLEACRTVSYGETVPYGQLARLAGNPKAARAVGAAMARNPLPLVIPCHRVIAGDGSLGGFSAEQGVDLKRKLLAMEASAVTRSVIESKRASGIRFA